MGRLTVRQMVSGVGDLLATHEGFKQVQVNEALSETIAEEALVQIYFQGRRFVKTDTDRRSFGGRREEGSKPVRVKQTQLHIDIYARQRSQIGQDLSAVQDLFEIADELFETQDHKPFFNLEQVESFTYTSERVTFEVNNVKYSGVRFVLELVSM